MDEEEYLEYCNSVFAIDDIDEDGGVLQQLRDGDPVSDTSGERVPGCYRVKPARTE